MTTAGHFRDAAPATVPIAGVPWPTYKLVALLVGLLVFSIVAVATLAVGPAVLSGAGVATVVWTVLGLRDSARH